MKQYLLDLLECPCCHGKLNWNIEKKHEEEIEEAKATCMSCYKVYPVHEGIALFVTSKLTENDPWETADSQMMMMFKQYPEMEQALLQAEEEAASPNDLFIKTLILDERGDFLEAKRTYESAHTGLYTEEMISSMKSQFNFVIHNITDKEVPIVDIASGRCLFAEELVLKTENPIVITDLSPRILRRNGDYFRMLGKYDRVSFVAMDAHYTPFRSGAVKTMTTFVGMNNIGNGDKLLQEMKRILSGDFYGIHDFFPDDDSENAGVIRNAQLDRLSFKESALACFASSGLNISIENSIATYEKPSEPGKIIPGIRVNAIPASEMTTEWCTLVCKNI